MKFKELYYRINDRVYIPSEIIRVWSDGLHFELTYIEEVDKYFIEHSIVCPTDKVEVIVDGT